MAKAPLSMDMMRSIGQVLINNLSVKIFAISEFLFRRDVRLYNISGREDFQVGVNRFIDLALNYSRLTDQTFLGIRDNNPPPKPDKPRRGHSPVENYFQIQLKSFKENFNNYVFRVIGVESNSIDNMINNIFGSLLMYACGAVLSTEQRNNIDGVLVDYVKMVLSFFGSDTESLLFGIKELFIIDISEHWEFYQAQRLINPELDKTENNIFTIKYKINEKYNNLILKTIPRVPSILNQPPTSTAGQMPLNRFTNSIIQNRINDLFGSCNQ